jgi:hypothetical protein
MCFFMAKDSPMFFLICYFMLEVVFLYLGTGVACYNAASSLLLHPLTWDWTSLWIILYCCSIFVSNGCYGIKLLWRELSLKFAHSSRQQKVYLIIASLFFSLLSFICQFAPFHLLIADFNLQKKRHNEKKAFSQLCKNPPNTCEKIRQLVETFKKRRQLDGHWKKLQKKRADYYLLDQIMENLPQLILLILITNTQETENTVGMFSLLLALSLWTWQRFLGYTCTVEGPLMFSGPSHLVAFFLCGFVSNMIMFFQFLNSIYGLTGLRALEITSGLTYSSELEDKNGQFINMSHVVIFMDMPLVCYLLAVALHFGVVVSINSDLGWAEKAKEALAGNHSFDPFRSCPLVCIPHVLSYSLNFCSLWVLVPYVLWSPVHSGPVACIPRRFCFPFVCLSLILCVPMIFLFPYITSSLCIVFPLFPLSPCYQIGV